MDRRNGGGRCQSNPGKPTLLFITFIDANLVVELGANLLEQFIEASSALRQAVRIHRHGGPACSSLTRPRWLFVTVIARCSSLEVDEILISRVSYLASSSTGARGVLYSKAVSRRNQAQLFS